MNPPSKVQDEKVERDKESDYTAPPGHPAATRAHPNVSTVEDSLRTVEA